MKQFTFKHFLKTALLLAAPMGHAADNELYAAPPPADAAFLRWIEAGPAPKVLGVTSLGQDSDAFHPVSAARTNGAQAGSFYTAAQDASGEVVVIKEPTRTDRSKVYLTLINLADTPVQLSVDEKPIVVVGRTDVNLAQSRAVNPVAIRLRIETMAGKPLGRFDMRLRRGQNITFIARPDGATLIENRFGANIGG